LIPKCFLHIGTEKTGTTTIQNFLAKNRDALLSQGIIYPSAPGEQNHMALAAFCLEDSKIDDVRIVCGIRRPQALPRFRKKLLDDLDTELGAADASCIVFSNEHLSSRLKTAAEIQRVREMCDRYAGRTKVIVYLRNQVDFLISSYGTTIMSGGTREFPFPLGEGQLRLLDYSQMLEPWCEIFGRENIIVRRFELEDFPKGDLLLDFAAQILLDTDGLEWPPRLNEALDVRGLVFLREFNKHVPRIVDGHLNPLRGQIVLALRELKQGQKFAVSPEIAASVEKQLQDSNDKVSTDYFDARHKPLFSPPKSIKQDADLSQHGIDATEAINIAAQLWTHQQNQIVRLQKKAKMAVGHSKHRRKGPI
jgi:hypothetical protein